MVAFFRACLWFQLYLFVIRYVFVLVSNRLLLLLVIVAVANRAPRVVVVVISFVQRSFVLSFDALRESLSRVQFRLKP